MKSKISFLPFSTVWLSGKNCHHFELWSAKKIIDIILLIAALVICSTQFAAAKNKGEIAPKKNLPTGNLSIPGGSGLYKLYTSLYAVDANGNKTLSDGIVSTFYPTYNNAVDNQDAPKLNSFNTKESLSILRDGVQLAIEKRAPVTAEDTTYLEVLQMDFRSYQFQFIAQNWDPLIVPYLKDSYTGTLTPINVSLSNDTTRYNFDVLAARPLTKEPSRFYIVFRMAGDLPVTYSSVKAFEQFNNVNIEWNVENEINVQQYSIERSKDGINFTKVYTQTVTENASANKLYNWIDTKPEQGVSYYRIAHTNKNGSIAYSKIMKVVTGKTNSSVNIFPTVLGEGTTQLQLNDMPKGVYTLRILSNNGSMVLTKSIYHMGGNATQTITTDKKILPGLYQLTITGPNNFAKNFKLIGR